MEQFRVLIDSEYEAWNAIRTDALDVAPFAFGRSNEDEATERTHRFASNINREDRFILGAFDGDELIGIAGFYRHEPKKTSHKGTIWSVFIKPNWQGKGLGRNLMEETLLEAWKMADLETILLGVSSNNPTAFNLYKNLGFVEYGREPNCLKHKGEYVDEILMVMKRD
jgi:ribosomal protein S18 acetylase RimI-like enzyme